MVRLTAIRRSGCLDWSIDRLGSLARRFISQWVSGFVGSLACRRPTGRFVCLEMMLLRVMLRNESAMQLVGHTVENAETRLHALVVSMSGSMSVQIERSDNTVWRWSMHIRCIGVGVPFVSTCNIVGGLFSRVGASVVSTVFISFVLSRLCERLPIRRRRFVLRFD